MVYEAHVKSILCKPNSFGRFFFCPEHTYFGAGETYSYRRGHTQYLEGEKQAFIYTRAF